MTGDCKLAARNIILGAVVVVSAFQEILCFTQNIGISACSQAEGICSSGLQLNITILDWRSPLSLATSVPAGTYLAADGSQWILRQSLNITVQGLSRDTLDAVGFPLNRVSTVSNAYEASLSNASAQGIHCSQNQTTVLQHNSTVWNVFRILQGQKTFPLTISVRQQFVQTVMLVDAYSSGSSAPGVSIVPTVSRSEDLVVDIPQYLVTADHPPTFDEGFKIGFGS